MKYITEDDLKIFEEEERLDKKFRDARQTWLNEVKRSHNGEVEYEDTKPSFDSYVEAHHKWQDFFRKHSNILLAQEIK